MVPETLVNYIETQILPCYDAFDKGHQRDHARTVIEQGLYLSQFYDVDEAIVYTACACHDLGLREDRKTHHLVSGRIIREELAGGKAKVKVSGGKASEASEASETSEGKPSLSDWFSPEQIELIAQAAEDHRASSDHEPRTIYGKIVAEADRQINADTVIRRTVQYGLSHYPELDKEGHWNRTLEHMAEKYAEGGYLKLWVPESPNATRLEELRAIIRDRAELRRRFEIHYERETKV